MTSVSPRSQPSDGLASGSIASSALSTPTVPPSPGVSFQRTDSTDSSHIRRGSLQFVDSAINGTPLGRTRTGSIRDRKLSPPPGPKFESRVSFDTFEKKNDGVTTSFSLSRKHVDFNHTKQSRTFLCGLDSNDYSEYALEWLIDELVDDGDEVVCLRVVDKDSSIAGTTSLEQGLYKQEADTLIKSIESKNAENKAINIILEFTIGKVEKVIMSMIKLYEPALLIVGTRGRNLGGIQGLLPGSVSKYCLQNSPIPVIVVRPNNQRARGKRKRQKDPSRQVYRDLLDKSQGSAETTDVLDRLDVVLEGGQAFSPDEAAAVARAIGVDAQRIVATKESPKGSPLVKMQSAEDQDPGKSQSTDEVEPSSLETPLNIPQVTIEEANDEEGGGVPLTPADLDAVQDATPNNSTTGNGEAGEAHTLQEVVQP